MILLIDNYDSFVHNLARYLRELGQATTVIRNDAVAANKIVDRCASGEFAAVILSPGPCGPAEAGICLPFVQAVDESLPVLGVCLGHQVIGAAFGARVVRAAQPVHGRLSHVHHNGGELFRCIDSPFRAGRYHSLTVEETTLPHCLEPIAHTADGTLMAIQHRDRPIFGLQFHPESILTDCGHVLLTNFLRLAGLENPGETTAAQELSDRPPAPVPPPDGILPLPETAKPQPDSR